MPFILEGFWLLFKLWLGLLMLRENRRQKWSDPQVIALKQYGNGYAHLQSKNWVKALEELEVADQAERGIQAVGHWLRGEAWFGAGKLEQARVACDRALALDLYNSHVYYLKARVLAAQGRFREAVNNLESSLRLASANPDVHVLEAHCKKQLGLVPTDAVAVPLANT